MLQAIHEHLHVSLFHIARSSYRSLRLVENTHPYWALSYVASGCVETVSRGTSFIVNPGEVMIHPPGVAYSELASHPGTHEWLLLEATLSPNIDLLRMYPVTPVVHLSSTRDFSHIFDALLILWQEEAPAFRGLQMLALTTQLLSLILQSWQQSGSIPRPSAMMTSEDRFTQVINYMADHLNEKISRDHLADIVGLHPVYFDRLFRQTYDVPPMQMLRDMRLERAKRLLESTDFTMETIAHTCGFGYSTSFVRVFQQKFGQTPGDYRQGLKQARNRYVPFL